MLKFAGRRARRYAGFVFSPPPPEALQRPSGQQHRLFSPRPKSRKDGIKNPDATAKRSGCSFGR